MASPEHHKFLSPPDCQSKFLKHPTIVRIVNKHTHTQQPTCVFGLQCSWSTGNAGGTAGREPGWEPGWIQVFLQIHVCFYPDCSCYSSSVTSDLMWAPTCGVCPQCFVEEL